MIFIYHAGKKWHKYTSLIGRLIHNNYASSATAVTKLICFFISYNFIFLSLCYVTAPRLLFSLMLNLLCDDFLTRLRHFMLLRHNVFLSSSDVKPVWWVTAPAVTGSGPAAPPVGPPWPTANTAGSRSHARSGSQPRYHNYMSHSLIGSIACFMTYCAVIG